MVSYYKNFDYHVKYKKIKRRINERSGNKHSWSDEKIKVGSVGA